MQRYDFFCDITAYVFADLTFGEPLWFLPVVITYCFTNYLFFFYIDVLKDVNKVWINKCMTRIKAN